MCIDDEGKFVTFGLLLKWARQIITIGWSIGWLIDRLVGLSGAPCWPLWKVKLWISDRPSNQWLYSDFPTEKSPGPFRTRVPWSHGGTDPAGQRSHTHNTFINYQDAVFATNLWSVLIQHLVLLRILFYRLDKLKLMNNWRKINVSILSTVLR